MLEGKKSSGELKSAGFTYLVRMRLVLGQVFSFHTLVEFEGRREDCIALSKKLEQVLKISMSMYGKPLRMIRVSKWNDAVRTARSIRRPGVLLLHDFDFSLGSK